MYTVLALASLVRPEVQFPENIEHCERMVYLEPADRTFYDQCNTGLTLYYILTK